MRVLSEHHVSKDDLTAVKTVADTAAVDATTALRLVNELNPKVRWAVAFSAAALAISTILLAAAVVVIS